MARLLLGLILLLPARPVLAQPDGHWGRHHDRGARILILKDYHLDADATAPGDVVVLGGNATIDGKVDDDVVVMGGSLRVGPKAEIEGDVVSFGGEARIDPQAKIHGRVKETVLRWPEGNWEPIGREWFSGFALIATLMRLLLVFVVASLLTLVAPGWVRGLSWRAAEAPGMAVLTGLACEIAFVPIVVILVVALAISLVGIPLIGFTPLLLAAAGLAATAGFAAVAARIGARVRGTTVEASDALFVDMLIGFVAVTALSVIARLVSFGPFWAGPLTLSLAGIGWLIEWVVWTLGIGAACVSVFSRWNGPLSAHGVPPAPPTAPAPTTI